MFPTFISILDIQSWWEVPSIAHFCSLFRTAFNLLDFDIEDLEEALLTDGTEESSWLQELIVRLLSGCLPNNEISTFNYQMFLRRLFRQKCQEHDRYNPFNTDIDFQILPLRTKVDILHALCDFRLDADDVLDQLKNLEADSLRVEPLGFDGNDSAYWYFYGTRLYREDYTTKNNKKKSVWQVICFTEDDWFQLTKKFKKSASKPERQLHHTLSENFLPELPRLFKEKESLARKRLLDNQPRRTSNRLRKLECDTDKEPADKAVSGPRERRLKEEEDRLKQEEEAESRREELEKRRQEAYERRLKLKRQSEEDSSSETSAYYEMAGSRNKKSKTRQRKSSDSSNNSRDDNDRKVSKRDKKHGKNKESGAKSSSSKPTTVGRQTNNSLSAATGQILIQPLTNPNKKKLKTSQVFRQTDEDLQTGMHKILDYVKNHEDAWPFADPVEEEYAPNYYTVIRKPMDLQRMEERLDAGYYKNFSKFRTDFQLIVDNCRLYNGAENEYTEMVGNLLQVFERATDKYLDQISSSDDEIAIEFAKEESVKATKTKQLEEVSSTTTSSRRKPMLMAQTDRKRDKSISEESLSSLRSNSYESLCEEIETNPRRRKRNEVSESLGEKQSKSSKSKVEEPEAKKHKPDSTREKHEAKKDAKKDKLAKKEKPQSKKETLEEKEKIDANKNKLDAKKDKLDPKKGKLGAKKGKLDAKKEKFDAKKEKLDAKKDKTEKKKNKHDAKKMKADKKAAKESKSKSKKANKKERRAQVRSRSPSRSPSRSLSRSPPPSDRSSPPPSWPPSSPDSRFDFMQKHESKKGHSKDMPDSEDSLAQDDHHKSSPFEDYFQDFEESLKHQDKKPKKDEPPPSPKPKDKHNKLRETIEKLKAKSEMKLQLEFELDPLKENKDKNKKPEKEDKVKSKPKEKPVQKLLRKDAELDLDGHSTMDSILSDGKKTKKLASKVPNIINKNTSNMDALSIATEQTLKDINKWLDDTPKFSEFSSASNSPSYTGLDEFEAIAKPDQIPGKKLDKPPAPKKEGATKDQKKRPFRDPSKFFKRREVQRTIDRLQPGKGKGNLISNVQNAGKADETYPLLGPLSKLKDAKNSLIVKTDTNAPKLSLGSVLDSFGKHKFVDDQKKEPEKVAKVEEKEENPAVVVPELEAGEAKQSAVVVEVPEVKESKADKEAVMVEEAISGGGATPNLSAWFKAFGAPKMQPPAKKADDKPEHKSGDKLEEIKPVEPRKVALPAASPNTDIPSMPPGQPMPRQRRISTGSSMSERSSFSQDMDSPRVGMEERGAYPAPYPSPLHKSPSGVSPIMASPRPDISPKSAAYPTINGQMRVGFYQDTVSTKSSPDKSSSPRENPTQSPYPHYSEHVYAPNTTENAYYNYVNSPYYTQAPNYSSTNPTPPYNADGGSTPSYYDVSKSPGEQFAKAVQNYTANSPSSHAHSQQHSPLAHMEHSPHSPGVYSQHSPTILPQNSPNVRAQQLSSPALQHSPNQMVHSPNQIVHSPNQMVHSPNQMVHSPNQMVHSPNQMVHSPNQMVHSPNLLMHSPGHMVHSPNLMIHSPGVQTEESPCVALPEQSPILIQSSPETDAFQTDDREKTAENALLQQQNAAFPVKKRAYADSELPQINKQRYEIDRRLTQQLEQKRNQASLAAVEKKLEGKPYVHQNIPDPKASGQVVAAAQKQRENYPAVSNAFGSFGNESNFSLNIPTARTLAGAQQDLSQYTNMGYTGPEVSYTRSLQQFARTELNYTATSAPTSQKLSTTASSNALPLADISLRYGDPNAALQQMSYKGVELGGAATNSAQANARSSGDIGERLSQSLSHIVDRFGSEERMMAGLQSSSSFYGADKSLASPHMFNKPISSSSSALPIFSQSNVAAMQSYSQNVQGSTTAMYNRQMSELQNAAVMQNDLKASQQMQAQEKKSKKRKSSKNAAASISESQQQATANQGFQSYAGLKGTTSMEPSAISLKTSSVVPGSAFNFGPTPTGLGIGSGLYSDKDAYPNFLDEFRSAPNYYMAAAAAQAAHHRATPEASEKQTRPAHQSSNPQSTPAYPFLGAPQAARSSYPIGGPFIPNAQGQLMDTGSPLYQHYLQAGVLNQSLLGPPGAYPPGYHPALSMRQPYESITRPPWL